MDSFQFELVSPEKLFFSGAVESVVVPGTEGDFEVLARHMPLMSTIRPGIIQVREKTGAASRRIFVRNGFADGGPSGLTILAEQIVAVEDLTSERLASEIELAEAAVSLALNDGLRADRAHRLGQLKELRRNLAL